MEAGRNIHTHIHTHTHTQAPENQKALKEAYVCLKLAHLSNASQNVLEYFSAALLPSNYLPGDNSFIQIFMEIMPSKHHYICHMYVQFPGTCSCITDI